MTIDNWAIQHLFFAEASEIAYCLKASAISVCQTGDSSDHTSVEPVERIEAVIGP
jgi:hypothetical protein